MPLLVIHVVLCIFLAGVILLQPGKSDAGIGFGSSSSQSIFGSRGAGNFLTKTTTVVAVLFLVTSFALARYQIQTQAGISLPEETSSEPALEGAPGEGAAAPAEGAEAPPEAQAPQEPAEEG